MVPAPSFCVLPISTRTLPLRTLANNSFFLTSDSASCIKATSSSGTPRSMSFRFISSYTLKPPSFFGVERSEKTSWVSFSSLPFSQNFMIFSTQRLSFEVGSSSARGLISRWSNPNFLPSFVILSILSSAGFTSPLRTAVARSDNFCTYAF